MQHRFFSGICPQKYNEQMQCTPAHDCISSGESIPGELLLSRAHFRFDSFAKFVGQNYIYKLLKKTATFQCHISFLALLYKQVQLYFTYID